MKSNKIKFSKFTVYENHADRADVPCTDDSPQKQDLDLVLCRYIRGEPRYL
jgi:hypothetical protein